MPFFRADDGTELAYHVQGAGSPLICLPGGPMLAAAYLGDLGGLAASRQVIRLDLRGTGQSAVPADPASYRCDRRGLAVITLAYLAAAVAADWPTLRTAGSVVPGINGDPLRSLGYITAAPQPSPVALLLVALVLLAAAARPSAGRPGSGVTPRRLTGG